MHFSWISIPPYGRRAFIHGVRCCVIATPSIFSAPKPGPLVRHDHSGSGCIFPIHSGAALTIYFAVLIGIGVTTLSVLVGVTAGFLGGWVDHLLSLVINIFLLIPGLPLMIVLAALLPTGPGSIALVLIVTGWPWGARVLRSQALTLSQRPFMEAAKLSGDDRLSLIFIHLVPNMLVDRDLIHWRNHVCRGRSGWA